MKFRFLHLFPNQLGLNGETGNLNCLVQRLSWAGIESEIVEFDGSTNLPDRIDAVFIGSGTLAGAIEALEKMRPVSNEITNLAGSGVPFLALGLGWEILGRSITLTDGTVVQGVGIFPSRSKRTNQHASVECFGFDDSGNLTTGYANHSSEIELLDGVEPLINLEAGYGNSSITDAKHRSDEGLVSSSLMAARMNGPLLPLNPHLADRFLALVTKRSGVSYEQNSAEAKIADGFASKAREELRNRLAR
jgi:CobQ-like glutamine amidotransferase family enzyme